MDTYTVYLYIGGVTVDTYRGLDWNAAERVMNRHTRWGWNEYTVDWECES